MVEWLLTNFLIGGESLSAYIAQFQQTVRTTIGKQVMLWTLVVLFIVLLRWLTRPRNNVT